MRPIIIEGTDGVGKTTLAKRLVAKAQGVYRHAGPPTSGTWVAEYAAPLIREYPWVLKRVIFDRWHVGEMVWPRLMGRESLFASPREFDACNEVLALLPHPPIVYIIDRQPDAIREELERRGEDRAAIERSLEARKLFLELAPMISRHLHCHVLDSDDVHVGGEDVLRT